MAHIFNGKWITHPKMSDLVPVNVFHRQIDSKEVEPSRYFNQHILFRKTFEISEVKTNSVIYISADDYYKLYINGVFIAQGPAPAYSFAYNYNTIDIAPFLKSGKNVLAVHTLYQGLINRVWVSGDNQHGLILDLEIDGKPFLYSDESFLCKEHSAYRAIGIAGYRTQFLENYDSNADETGFEFADFCDSDWMRVSLRKNEEYRLVEQPTEMLKFEKISPARLEQKGNNLLIDFGACYVGYLDITAKGQKNDIVTVRCGQELKDDGSVRYEMRCNCNYEEMWILSGNKDKLDWFDYKSFRYAEIAVPDGCVLFDIYLTARHYPFTLRQKCKKEFLEKEKGCEIWNLCVRTLEYGVQEVIQDCMDREKGFYVGDGCYTALTYMILTNDDTIARYLIESSKQSAKFNKGTVTCLNCAFMQEIAEYPLIMISLMLWHYRITGDAGYLRKNFDFAVSLLDEYKKLYERDCAMQNLDKWCVVEWPKNFQDGYDVDISEGKICREPHNVINAYYIEAISNVNKMAKILHLPLYRDVAPLKAKYIELFYDAEKHIFRDSNITAHSSYISNIFAFSFGLCPDEQSKQTIRNIIVERGLSDVSFFAGFVLLCGMVRDNNISGMNSMLLEPGTWKRMLSEDATTTFEGWGKDTKWNTSLFHLTLSYGALFMADIDHYKLFS